MDVDALAPGRELDALVAEKVMGWVWVKDNHGSRIEPGPFNDCDCESHAGPNERIPYYSTEIVASLDILLRMDERREHKEAHNGRLREIYICGPLDVDREPEAKTGDPMAHAICLAALEAAEWGQEREVAGA